MIRKIFKSRAKNPSDKKLIEAVRLICGFSPGNISLYKQAFRHTSVATEIKTGVRDSNERLEYLGDAVLGAIVAEYLFSIYPFKGEGFLTQVRSRIVNRAQLNQLAKKLGFEQLIQSDLRNNNAVSILGDAFEAFVGAVYLDKGFAKTKGFVVERIIKLHLDIDEIQQTDTDYKSRLINYCQREKKKLCFNLLEEIGSGNKKEFVIGIELSGKQIAKSQHTSKRRAEQLAAEIAISFLEEKGKEV